MIDKRLWILDDIFEWHDHCLPPDLLYEKNIYYSVIDSGFLLLIVKSYQLLQKRSRRGSQRFCYAFTY